MSRLVVARAEASDAVAVEALLDAAAEWQQSRGISQWKPGQFRHEIREAIASGEQYVARRERIVVGSFLLDTGSPSWMSGWLVERRRVPSQGAHVGRLTVAREASGHGLGAELLHAAGAIAAQRGRTYLRLDCPAENARLRRYYLEVGFSYLGDLPIRGPNGEHWVCSVFERPIVRSGARGRSGFA